MEKIGRADQRKGRMGKWLEEHESQIREFKHSLQLLKRNPLSMTGLIIIFTLVIIAIFAPYISPYPEQATNPNLKEEEILIPPNQRHLFGTDRLGRDVLTRIIYGTRIALEMMGAVIALGLLIGVPLGAIAGTCGGKIDTVIMRICDAFLSFPPLLLIIVICAVMGPNLMNAMIAVTIAWWPWYTRIIRNEAVSVKERAYVKAANSIGVRKLTIVFRHILPNSIAPVITQATLDAGAVILTLAGLSFLGLGAQPPSPDWGLMISTSRHTFPLTWWWTVFPGLFIFLTALSFNLLGDAFRDVLDPRLRRR